MSNAYVVRDTVNHVRLHFLDVRFFLVNSLETDLLTTQNMRVQEKMSERLQPISHQTGATNVCARLFMSRTLAPVPRTSCRPANRSISRSVNLIVCRSGGLSLASGSVTECIERASIFCNEFEGISVQRVRQQLDITRGPRGRTAPHQRTCGAVPCTQAGALSEIACDHRRARMHPAACECACVEGIPT